ncbi:hypothetical protein M8494_34605 (plasmid) [Serratia ureilytica]
MEIGTNSISASTSMKKINPAFWLISFRWGGISKAWWGSLSTADNESDSLRATLTQQRELQLAQSRKT